VSLFEKGKRWVLSYSTIRESEKQNHLTCVKGCSCAFLLLEILKVLSDTLLLAISEVLSHIYFDRQTYVKSLAKIISCLLQNCFCVLGSHEFDASFYSSILLPNHVKRGLTGQRHKFLPTK
jgi:hypothetical protein